jgi:hypothetical protein
MEIQPKSLNVPLQKKNYFWLVASALVLFAGLVMYFVSPGFGKVFLATSLLVLPVLLLLLASPSNSPYSRGTFVVVIGLLYAFAAKNYALPWLVAQIP